MVIFSKTLSVKTFRPETPPNEVVADPSTVSEKSFFLSQRIAEFFSILDEIKDDEPTEALFQDLSRKTIPLREKLELFAINLKGEELPDKESSEYKHVLEISKQVDDSISLLKSKIQKKQAADREAGERLRFEAKPSLTRVFSRLSLNEIAEED